MSYVKIRIGYNDYALPRKEGLELFALLSDAKEMNYETVNGVGMYVIQPSRRLTLTVEPLSEVEYVAMEMRGIEHFNSKNT